MGSILFRERSLIERFVPATSRLYRALILLGLALCLPSTSVSLVFVVLYINVFLLTSFSVPFSELSLVGLAVDVVD